VRFGENEYGTFYLAMLYSGVSPTGGLYLELREEQQVQKGDSQFSVPDSGRSPKSSAEVPPREHPGRSKSRSACRVPQPIPQSASRFNREKICRKHTYRFAINKPYRCQEVIGLPIDRPSNMQPHLAIPAHPLPEGEHAESSKEHPISPRLRNGQQDFACAPVVCRRDIFQ